MPMSEGMGMAIGGIAGLVNTGIGYATSNWTQDEQRHQANALMEIQMRGQKEMGKYNQALALDTWEKTGYEAQRKQLEKAGLNPGLMYGQAGAGGTTQTAPGQVSGQAAQENAHDRRADMGMGIEALMAASVIEMNKANANRSNAEADAIRGYKKGEAEAGAAESTQRTENLKLEAAMQGIENSIATMTMAEAVEKIAAEVARLQAEARAKGTEADVSEATKWDQIQQQRQTTAEQSLRMAAIKAGTEKTKVETEATRKGIERMAEEIVNMRQTQRAEWRKWEQGEKERWIREKEAEIKKQIADFETSDAARIKQWIDVVDGIIGATKALTPAGMKPYSPY